MNINVYHGQIMFSSYFFIFYLILICTNLTYCTEVDSQKYNKYLKYFFNKYGSRGQISLQGLEQLMYNVGIGGFEFNPNHTINEKRTENFNITEILNNDNVNNVSKTTMLLKRENDENININHNDSDIKYKNKFLMEEENEENINHIMHRGGGTNENSTCLSPTILMNKFVHKRTTSDKNINSNIETMSHQNVNFNEEINVRNNENISSFYITPEIFVQMCPIILAQIEQGSCHIVEVVTNKSESTFNYAWEFASISVLIISMCGLAGVALIPLTKSLAYDEILRFLISLAVGTLCGDALMHLLPHALTPVNHESGSHSHDSVWICGCTFLSAVIMFIIEKGVPIVFGAKHSHSHGTPVICDNLISTSIPNNGMMNDEVEMNNTKNNQKEHVSINDNRIKSYDKKIFKLSPVALMVVIGDGLHNITDGLAIGAAFALDPITGMSTALAVLCHELPHELGDFALLLQSGISMRVAFYYNIASSILSFIGMAIGILIVQNHNMFVRWIYSATAGSFLYIALVDLIPEMGHNSNNNLKQFLIQLSGIILGGFIMLMIGINEDRLKYLFQ